MAKYILTVPLEAQQKSNVCWLASAFMVWRYWQGVTGRQGPMFTIPGKYEKNEAIYPAEFITLATNVGLQALPVAPNRSSDDLAGLLKSHGPIWCAGFWYGPGHVIVLTGVDGGTVHLNDPDGGVRKKETVAWFNKKLSSQLQGSMMYKDPKRY